MIKLRCSLALLLAMLLALGGAAAWADGALVLPQRLTEIEEEAFFGDTSLDYVIVPEGVHKIGERAFANSSVQTGYLPGSLGEIPDSAFANAPLRCVITPGGSEAGRWAEARGIHVAYNNELSVMPQDNNWWVYAQYGDTADLHVFCQGQDLEGSSLSWYRIETDNNGMDDWIDLDRHEFSLTTEPVEGHLRYVCRLTDRFGFQNDAWFDVMVDNGLELWSENGSDRVCVPNGEGATLRVGFRANDTDGLCFQWYQVEQDENGFDRWTELEGKTETEYITPAVTGQAQYVCRMTDRFGSMRDFWFRVSIAAQESAVSAGAAYNVSGTTALIPLTYSVTAELAEQGYRMGVLYTEIPGGLLPDENGRYENAYEWTWGGESGVYGPANAVDYDGWLDELIPGHIYNYVACIVNEEHDVVVVDDHPRHFTTTDGSEVYTLTLDERIAVAADNAKTPFRFVLPTDGVYSLNASVPMDEMSVRATDECMIGWGNDVSSISFFAHAEDTVYLFVRDHDEDAQISIRFDGAAPEQSSVSSDEPDNVGAVTAGVPVTYSISESMARDGYRVGVAFSTNRDDLLGLNEDGRFNCAMWDWDYLNSVEVNKTVYRWIDTLCPGTHYYLLAYISVNDRVEVYEPAENIKELTTAAMETLPAIGETDWGEVNWTRLQQNERNALRFTADRDGIYGLIADRQVSELGAIRAGRTDVSFDNETDLHFFAAHAGDTVVLFVRDWNSEPGAMVRYFIEFPTENSVSSEIAEDGTDVGSTWLGLDVTYDVTEETADNGYHVGVAFGQNREDLELNEQSGRFNAEMWDWEYLTEPANNAIFYRHLNQLIPDSTYYYRAYISAFGQVIACEDIHEIHTGSAGEIALLTLDETLTVEDEGFQIYRYTAAADGVYTLECRGMNFINITGEDGRGIVGSNEEDNENRHAVLGFALQEGETVYVFLDSNGGAELTLGMGPGPLPTIALDSEYALSDNRIVVFTAPETGWYTFSVDQPWLGGLNFYNTWYHSWVGLPLGFNADATSLPLEQGQIMYFCSWYDMNWGTIHLTVEQAISPENNAIVSSNLEAGDTWAQMDLTFSVTEESIARLDNGYDAGIAYSRFESFEDENGNYQGDEWGWDSLRILANDYTMTRTLDRLVPGTTYYYYAYLRDNNTGEYLAREETKSFTTDAAGSITSLTLGTPVTPPYDGSSVFRFQADEAGIYALVYCGIMEVEVRNASGNWITSRGYDNLEIGPDTGLGFLAGEGEEFYIFVFNGDPDAFLAVENRIDALPALTVGEWSEELWGRQVVTFTAPEDGWYRFDIRSNWYGHIHFASLEYGWDEPMESDDSATRYLKAGETVYPGSWFDDDMARVSYKVTAVTPVEEASVTTLDVSDIGDVSAHFGLRYGIPELPEPEGWYYNVGVLLRADDDPGFAGGDSWTEVYADRSMVNWHRSAPSELRELSFGDDLPLLPDTAYCYEAFIEFYNEETGEAGTYFGGLKRFTTAKLDREVTSVTAGEEIEVPWREDGEYQMFSFTVPEDPVDVYAFTVYGASAWVANAQGDVIWPMDVFNGGRRCFMVGNGHAGETYTIYLKVWNGEGIRFTIEERPAQELGLGVNNDVPLYTFLRFTVPETGYYLVANTDSRIFPVCGDGNRGFNYLYDSDWNTGPLEAGDTVLFFLVNDDGHFEEGQTATVAIVKTDGISVATEEELRRTLDAVTVLSSRERVDAEVSVDGAITLTDNLILSPAVILTLNAPLTVPSGITFTNGSDILIPSGGSLSVQSDASLVMVDAPPTWVASISVDGGTLTVNGSFTPTNKTNIWIMPDHYDGLEEQMAAVSGIAPADLALTLVVGDDASLEIALTQAQSYHAVELILAEGYIPTFAAIEALPGNVEVVLSEGAALVVPAGETLTLNSRFTVQGGTLTVNGTLAVNDWLYLNEGAFINNGTFLLNSGGIAWPDGICAIENHGTMTLAEGSRFVLYSYDYSEDELSAVVTNTGTVNLYADVTGNVRFEGSGTVNESEA